jgi:hypothetical protein
MPTIDPNDPIHDKGGKRFHPRADARGVYAVTRYHREDRTISGQTVPTITVGLVCVRDLTPDDKSLDPANDVGLCTTAQFLLRPDGYKWIARFAKALGHGPFDPHLVLTDAELDAEDADPSLRGQREASFDDVIAANKGILIGTCAHRSYVSNGKERTTTELRSYEPASLVDLGLVTPIDGEQVLNDDIAEIIAGGERDYDEMRRRQAEAIARRRAGGGGGARSGDGGGGAADKIPF